MQFPDAIPNYGRLINICLGDTASFEAQNYEITPIDYFLGIAKTHRSDSLWGQPVIGNMYDPNQQYQDILRSLLHSGVGTYISASEIVTHKKKTELVNMLGNSESMPKPDCSANPLHVLIQGSRT